MAWTVPADFTTGRLVSASDWNAEMGTSGNMSLTMPAIVTTAGDLAYATGANALARLAIGSVGYLLASTGSAPAWSSALASSALVKVSDSGTAAVVNALTLGHNSSGTPAANYGTGLLLQGKSSTTADQDMAAIQAYWTTATHASRAAGLAFQTVQGAGSLTTRMVMVPSTGGSSVAGDQDFGFNTTADIGSYTGPKATFYSAGTGTGNSAVLQIIQKGTAAATTGTLGELLFGGLNGGTTSVVGSAQIYAQLDGATNKTKLFFESQNGGAASQLVWNSTGQLLLNTSTANAKMTTGLTINQGGADDEILALKSSDVAHGMTSIAETDTYLSVQKFSATAGGAWLRGLSEDTSPGLFYSGYVTTSDTTRGTSAVAAVYVSGNLKSGASATSLAANGNLFAVADVVTTRFIVDVEGDVHYDATTNANAWDEHDDLALIEAFRVVTGAPRNYRKAFAEDVERHARVLRDTGVITLNDDGHHFVSTKGLNGLLIDTIRQLAANVDARLKTLERHPALAGA